MVDDVADLVSPPVVTLEPGRVLVGHLGPLGDGAAGQRAELLEQRLGEVAVAHREMAVHEELQMRVGLVPVQADGRLEGGVVDHPDGDDTAPAAVTVSASSLRRFS